MLRLLPLFLLFQITTAFAQNRPPAEIPSPFLPENIHLYHPELLLDRSQVGSVERLALSTISSFEARAEFTQTEERTDSSGGRVRYEFSEGYLKKITVFRASHAEVIYLNARGPVFWKELLDDEGILIRMEHLFVNGSLLHTGHNADCGLPRTPVALAQEEMRLLLRLQYLLQLI